MLVGTYHSDRSVGQVDELGQHLPVFPSSIELGSVPERQHSADQLGKALGPVPVWVWAAI